MYLCKIVKYWWLSLFKPQSTSYLFLWWNAHTIKLTILKSVVQWHLIHSQCYAATTSLVPKHSHHPKIKPVPIKHSVLIPHYPQPLATTSLLFVLKDLPILGNSCKWNPTLCGFWVWLLSLSLFWGFIHITACINISFLFKNE